MKIEIDGNVIRISSKYKALRLCLRSEGDTEIISMSICSGGMARGGLLPSVEFTGRDVLLRHIGNRLEKVR